MVHPSNEVLSSDILPRWAIIGWLLTTCTVRGRSLGRLQEPGRLLQSAVSVCFQSNVAASNAKLALFYDWLFFNPEKDSIMNIGNTRTRTHAQAQAQAWTLAVSGVNTLLPLLCVRTSHPGDASLHEASSRHHRHAPGLHVPGTHTHTPAAEPCARQVVARRPLIG